MRSLRGVAFFLLFTLCAAMLWGQTGTSAIRGTVTDPQGRVVAGAKITLTNKDTNNVRTTESTDGGAYAFEFITPADYRIEAEAKGFKKKVIDDVHALIGKQVQNDIALEVGASNETVEVKATSQDALINTQDATLGNNFVSEQITQLPLEARNLVDLLSLQPGSTREGYVTGARADQSNVTLDGVDINNAQTGNAEVPRQTNGLMIGALDNDRGNITTGPVLRLNAEAIEEFRVTTANGNANQGRSSGSQVNLVTKAGTNSFHGAGFEFYRSRGFTANDWFNNHSDPVVPRTPLVRNTFGGALGGPIIKDKAFFFYSYEGRHDASGQGVTRIVPLANLGQGTINYEYCTDDSCSSTQQASLDLSQNQSAFDVAGINPAALNALADAASKYPANDSSQGDGLNTGGFRFNAPTPARLNSHVGKLDINLTKNQNVFLRANVIYDHQTLPQWLPDTASPQVWNHPWGLAAGHTWTIGNNWVNNFRYGYTRQAFTNGGDSSGNDTDFRFVFQPNGETHSVDRVTPVHNFTDDVSWIRGTHSFQFGTNIRFVSNSRTSFAAAYDFAETNPSFYLNAGANIPDLFQQYLDDNGLPGANGLFLLGSAIQVRNAGTAIIGRFSQYNANFTFAKDGSLLDAGSPSVRDFATQAYDTYLQDTWKVRPNLTLTLGLRYSLERPVYETQGFEVQPTVPLGTYFAQRLAAADRGENFSDPIIIDRSGPANGGKPMYNWDKNNFQPRIAVAWSPEGGDGFFGRLLGKAGKSVVRGGFALTNDYYGQALAVDWDLNNTLGFTSSANINANTYDVTPSALLGPLFTGFGQEVRPLPNITVPSSLQFPLAQPLDEGERIEQSVDSKLHAPTEYVWNLTYERQLPAGMVFSASYIGRMGRSLLARRDVAAFNNIKDPQSGVDWYTAATMLEKQRQQGVDISQIQSIPFFDNLFPANFAQILNEGFAVFDCNVPPVCFDPSWSNTQAFYGFQAIGFFEGNDWTDVQAIVDRVLSPVGTTVFSTGAGPTRFMQPQYGTLSSWSTIGNSNYHALAISLRQRLSSLTLDFNYTFSHSLDDASGLQTEGGFGNQQGNGAFIVNPIRQRENYGNSDFDIRHSINASAIWQLPFGKGRAFMGSAGRGVDAILGGWQLSGIFRWNTGLPAGSPFDDGRWATNWDFQSNVTPTRPVHTCPSRPKDASPKLFGCGDIDQIYQSFRNAYPGENGPRNYLRFPGFVDVDLGLGKTWTMPWNEQHKLQVRWDVFNVTNTQRLTGIADFGVALDPGLTGSTAPDDWSNFTQIQGQPRVMQIGARYSF